MLCHVFWSQVEYKIVCFIPAPKYIPRPNASMSLFAKPNDIHQSDLLSLPHDKFKKKTYKYALNIVDVGCCQQVQRILSIDY